MGVGHDGSGMVFSPKGLDYLKAEREYYTVVAQTLSNMYDVRSWAASVMIF